MPVPTAYTESTLTAFLLGELGNVGTVLGWDSDQGAQQLAEAVTDTLLLLDVTDLADAPDIPKLRALGRVAIWRQARNSAAALYDQRLENGQVYYRSQMLKAIDAALLAAEVAAERWLNAYAIQRDTLQRPSGDPYAYYPDQWRTVS